jgi:hypothetical protein
MWDIRVEVVGKIFDNILSIFMLELIIELFQDVKTFFYVVFGEFAKGHLVHIETDLLHLFVHHV